MTAREKGWAFLKYAGENQPDLIVKLTTRWGCREDWYLEDAFGDALLRVYDNIVSRNLDLKNPESYFLRSVRSRYLRILSRENKLHGLDIQTEEDTQD